MDKKKLGEELGQLARFLFDSASSDWYLAIVLEIVAGIIGYILSVSNPSSDWVLTGTIAGFFLLGLAHYLRIRFGTKYDSAETMRRQSLLTEGLGWNVEKTQVSEWRDQVGKDVLNRFQLEPRDPDYYATKRDESPRKLLEMTIESAFYTRHLYKRLFNLLQKLLIIIGLLVLIALTLGVFSFIPSGIDFKIAVGVYTLLPILLSVDVFGWMLRLHRSISGIYEIERALEKLTKVRRLEEKQVLRYVFEYNCQVVQGFPIHNFLFRRWHDDIQKLWKRR